MVKPLVETSYLAIFMTLSFWWWSTPRLRSSVQLQKEDHRWLTQTASIGFIVLIGTQLVLKFLTGTTALVFAIMTLTFCFPIFAIVTESEREGFWRKRRNQIAGFLGSFLLATACVLFLADPIFAPTLFALAIAKKCHRKELRLYWENAQDLKAVQEKLLHLDAKIHSLKVTRPDPMATNEAQTDTAKGLTLVNSRKII